MRLAVAAIALAAVGPLALAGCGEKREPTGTGASGANAVGPTTLSVSETEFKLNPSKATVPKAGAVIINVTNAGTIQHALEVVTPAGELKTAPIAPGKSAALRADLKPGTYTWYCPIDGHKAKGMKGQVVVAGGGASSGGGSSGSGGGYSSGGGY